MKMIKNKIYRCRKCNDSGMIFKPVGDDLYRWDGSNIRPEPSISWVKYYCNLCGLYITQADNSKMINQSFEK